MSRPRPTGHYEEYRCGCVSPTVKRKKDLLGYCAKHGDSYRGRFVEFGGTSLQTERKAPVK